MTMSLRRLITSLSVWLVASTSSAQVISLQEVERAAVRSTALGEAASTRAARARLDEAGTNYNPRFSVTMEGTVSPGSELAPFKLENGDTILVQGTRTLADSESLIPRVRYGAGLSMDQLIYDFGRTSAARDAARAGMSATAAEIRSAREGIIRSVRDAYVDWLKAFQSVPIAQQAADAAQARVQRVTQLMEEGAASSADLPIVQQQALGAQVQLEAARAALDDARLVMERAMNSPLPADAQPDASLLELTDGSSAVTQSPSVLAMEERTRALHALAESEDSADAVTVGGRIQAGVRGQDDRVFPAYEASLRVTVPLWDGGLSSARADEQVANAEEASARAQALRADRDLERRRLLAALRHANEAVRLGEELVRSAQTGLAQTEERFGRNAQGFALISAAGEALRLAQQQLIAAKATRALTVLRLRPAE